MLVDGSMSWYKLEPSVTVSNFLPPDSFSAVEKSVSCSKSWLDKEKSCLEFEEPALTARVSASRSAFAPARSLKRSSVDGRIWRSNNWLEKGDSSEKLHTDSSFTSFFWSSQSLAPDGRISRSNNWLEKGNSSVKFHADLSFSFFSCFTEPLPFDSRCSWEDVLGSREIWLPKWDRSASLFAEKPWLTLDSSWFCRKRSKMKWSKNYQPFESKILSYIICRWPCGCDHSNESHWEVLSRDTDQYAAQGGSHWCCYLFFFFLKGTDSNQRHAKDNLLDFSQLLFGSWTDRLGQESVHGCLWEVW